MTNKEYACKRLRTFLDEISRLMESEFPYPHAKEALETLARRFEGKLGSLERRHPAVSSRQVNEECAKALESLFLSLPHLGFILRATNVRNAFEVYRPLLRLASSILEPGPGSGGKLGAVFLLGDILDLRSIIKRLKEPSETDRVAHYIRPKLSVLTLDLLQNDSSPSQMRLLRSLVNDLNRLAQGPLLSDNCDFNAVPLSAETKRLLARNPQGAQIVRANRFLLQDAFATEIVKWPKTRLLLSSEWHYSPFMIPETPELRNYVLIGLPAPESSNPLVIPLAGHELGHSLWSKGGYFVRFQVLLKERILRSIESKWSEYLQVFPQVTCPSSQLVTDLAAQHTFDKAFVWGLKQIEETFCDFVGLRIFGGAYLHAFAYLLSPNHSGTRSLNYPNMRIRAAHLAQCARQYHLEEWSTFEQHFEDLAEPTLTEGDQFQLKLACECLDSCVPDLVSTVDEVLTEAGIRPPYDLLSDQEVKRIMACFERVVPADGASSLSNILAAGWQMFERTDLWKDLEHVRDKRDVILKELVLKCIEIFEYEQIMEENT